MTVNWLTRALAFGAALATAACGEGLTLPPEGEAANITVTYGDGQGGLVSSPLRDSVVVEVTDILGRKVPGATVNFTFPDADASAAPGTATTNSNGIAWSKVTLGPQVGPVAGVAEVPVAPGITPVRVTFTATALPGNANRIAMVSGNEQSAPVGTNLPAPLVVQVSDQEGNPIPRVAVSWSLEGGGSVSAATTLTGDNGQTSVTRTLGPTSGVQTTLATAEGLVGSPVTFTHGATAGTANRIIKESGDGQSAPAGAELSDPLVVRVLDANDNPIPNEPVTWVPASGGGSVTPPNTTTDAQGFASTRWTLGPSAGTNTVTAVASRAGTSTVAFTATATAGTPSSTNSTVSASPETITAGSGSSTITVTVRDATNNPVSGVSVSITSTGTGNTITPASASTGGNGVATFTFSSTVPETKTIATTAGGVELNQRPTITVQKASSTVEITDDAPDPSTVGQTVRVEFTVTGSGGTPTGNVTVTVSDGTPTETCTGTLAVGSGFCDITLTVPGTGTNNRRVLTATYGGDARFSGDTDTENHRVNPLAPASTTTTITNDAPDPSAAGTAITVSFTVTSSAGTPNGNVQVTDPLGGSCNASVSTGSCQYTPGGTGLRTITATYEGGSGFGGSSDTEEHTVNPPATQAPVAVNDPTYTTPAGVELSVGAENGILVNDTDADTPHDLLTVNLPLVQNVSGGVLEIDASGTFQYTPNAGTTQDTFQYRARDPQGNLSNIATVTITITP